MRSVNRRGGATILAVGLALLLATTTTVGAAPEPGTAPPEEPVASRTAIESDALLAAAAVLQPPAPVTPLVTERGLVTLSVDGMGTTAASGTVDVEKPSALATVRSAYLAVASTGFTNHTPEADEITLNGQVVDFDPNRFMSTTINSVNAWADVTPIVAAAVDGQPAGIHPLTITEKNTSLIDGSILAVVFDDPTQVEDSTIVLAYGAQEVSGDEITIVENAAASVDVSVELGLGISFGFQPTNQYSTVDVNGIRLTSSAGGQDDGENANGALLTVGGLGDDPTNPINPIALGDDPTCPRCDDELYDLSSFLSPTGTTDITLSTANPSADDNVFFAALEVQGATADWEGSTVPLTFTMMQVVGCEDDLSADAALCPGGGPDEFFDGEYRVEVSINGDDVGTFGGDRTEEGDFNERRFYSTTHNVTGQTATIVARVIDEDLFGDEEIDVHPEDDRTTLEITVDLSRGTWTIDGIVGSNHHYTRGDGDTEHAGDGGHPAIFSFDISTLQPTSLKNATFGDADGDGLLDGWELFGLRLADITVDNPVTMATVPSYRVLRSFDVDPYRTDILVENDWIQGAEPVFGWSTGEATYADIVEAFAEAPVPMNLIFDTGSDPRGSDFGIDLGGGNEIELDTGDLAGVTEVCGVGDSEFYDVKEVHFNKNRRWAYRYALTGSARVYSSTSSCGRGGQAEIGGNDILNLRGDAVVMMHELGHSLTLRHGGDNNENCKPNYLSVMNYSYDRGVGIPLANGDDLFDFSPARRLNVTARPAVLGPIDEEHLDELPFDPGNTEHVYVFADSNGDVQEVRASVAPDFNANGDHTDRDIEVNISRHPDITACSGDTDIEVLTDHNDWSQVSAAFRQFGDSADSAINPSDDDGLIEFEEDLLALRQNTARSDLALTATLERDDVNDTATVSASLVGLDDDYVRAPEILVTFEHLEVLEAPAECELVSPTEMRCLFPDGLLSPDGGSPTAPLSLEIVFAPDASGIPGMVTLTASSVDNPVDNDPDPLNNVVEFVVDLRSDLCTSAGITISGTEGDDEIVGTDGDDVIAGFGGDDVIDGGGGNDVICGGEGNDVLYGGNGRDLIDGGTGDDTIDGGRGEDTMLGGSGDDTIIGGNGVDVVEAGPGADQVTGGHGDDSLYGDDGDDTLIGGRGDDHLIGGEGVDEAKGDRGYDRCSAEATSNCEE